MLDCGLIAPSCPRGVEAMRWMLNGAELSLSETGWTLSWPRYPSPWITVALSWCGAGAMDEAAVEWLLEDGFARQLEQGRRLQVTERGARFVHAIDAAAAAEPAFIVRADDLRGNAAAVRQLFPEHDNFVRAQMVAQVVLCTMLGEKWFLEHVVSKSAPTSFFRTDKTDDLSITVGGLRRILLAEMIWNLRDVPGMDSCIRLLYSGKVADAYAEMEVCKLLCAHRKTFRVVESTGVLGRDYDLEIDFDGVTACADTKCKLETTAMSEKTIMNSLGYARKQLPNDRPGIIFVALPQVWYDQATFGRNIQDVARAFLRNTRRVVSVKFHTSLIINAEGAASANLALLEVLNDNHRFDTGVAWNFYREMNAMPDSWVSILRECSDP